MQFRSLTPVLVLAALAVLVAPSARADQLNGGKIALKLKLPPENGGTGFEAPSATYLARYFNFSRCVCDTDSTTKEYEVEYTWDGGTPPSPVPSVDLHPWAGQNCNSDMESTRDANCNPLDLFTAPSISTLARIDYDLRDLIVGPNESACPEDKRAVQHWLVTQAGTVWDTENRFKLFESDLSADMQAPPLPTTLRLVPREAGIIVEWDALTDTTDIDYFQALCANVDGTKAHDAPTNSARFKTPRSTCGASYDYDIPVATVENPGTGTPGTLPLALSQLDTGFVCGEASGTARSITLGNLEDGKQYWVVLAAVDKSRNVAATSIDRPITPQPVTDFWEEINNEDGNIQGGFCIAQVGADGAPGAALLVGLAVAFAVRRRRRRRTRTLAAGVTVALLLIPALASAQETYSPYWDEVPTDTVGPTLPTWITQVRLGPYRPSIDASFSSSPGPYARTFLKDSLLFEVDVHRVWSVARGQLGVGFSAGYFTNSALAWQDGSFPGQPNRPRASGNLTRVSMVPTALTAIYRATIIDDEFGVPLVPYVRGGLAYNVWWMKNPADELSVAMSCPTCEDRAIGGTIGVVAAVGLAIRAERIDPTAATSMRNTGIEHAGFFAEIEAGWIDGFGKKSKLSVGDTTWFGGITFEF